jgi:hypothetical protein
MDSIPSARPEGDWRPPELESRLRHPPIEGSGHGLACLLAAAASAVGAGVASWWLIGNLSVHNRPPEDLDYGYRAPTVPHWVVATFGPIAFATVAVVIGTLIVAASRRIVDRRWLLVVGMLVLAGFLFALIGRTASAGTIGANIGGGMAILFVGPVVVALVVSSAISSVRIRASACRTEVLGDVSLPGHA